jgi:glycosyltransferase involved in cell wall biosynthesis
VQTSNQNILYLITVSEVGGAQKQVSDLITHFHSQFNKTYLMYGAQGQGSAFKNLPSPVIQILNHLLDREVAPFKSIFFVINLYVFLKKNKINVIHTHSSMSGFLGRLAAKLAGTPFIIHTVHGYAFHEALWPLKKRLYYLMEKWAAKWTHLIICVNKKDFQISQEQFKAKAVYIPNGVAQKTLNPEKQILLKQRVNQGFKLGTVANFYATKGLIPFLNIFKEVVQKNSNIHWYIAGQGPLQDEFRRKAHIKDLEKNIHLLGSLNEVPEFLSLVDAFLLPSKKEGMPLTLLEAMAQKVPVCVTEVGGMAEIIQDGQNGFFLKSADSILNLVSLDSAQKEAITQKAYQDYLESFTTDKMLSMTEKAYESIMNS